MFLGASTYPGAGAYLGDGDTDELVGSSGWYSLLAVLQEARQGVPRQQACPNDGTPYRTGPRGELFCPFDGYRPR